MYRKPRTSNFKNNIRITIDARVKKLKVGSMGKCSWSIWVTMIQVCTEQCDYHNIAAPNNTSALPMPRVCASLLPYLAALSSTFLILLFMYLNPFSSMPKVRCAVYDRSIISAVLRPQVDNFTAWKLLKIHSVGTLSHAMRTSSAISCILIALTLPVAVHGKSGRCIHWSHRCLKCDLNERLTPMSSGCKSFVQPPGITAVDNPISLIRSLKTDEIWPLKESKTSNRFPFGNWPVRLMQENAIEPFHREWSGHKWVLLLKCS